MSSQKANEQGIVRLQAIQKQLTQQIPLISKSNHYQFMLVALMSVAWLLATWASVIGSFVFMNPLFTCNGQSTTQVEACKIIDQCKIQNDFTAAYYDQLYCDKQSTRSLIQSFIYIGCFIGILTLVSLSDLKGRRVSSLATILSLIIGTFFLVIGIYSNVWILMCVGIMFCGMFSSSLPTISYLITGQMLNDKLRQQSYIFYCAIWGFAETTLILFYYFLPQWYNYLILGIGIPAIGLLCISTFFLIQTPQFCLFIQKNKHKFRQVIQKLKFYNQIDNQVLLKVNGMVDEYIQLYQKTRSFSKKSTLKSLSMVFCNRKVMLVCICLGICESAFNVFYFGMQGSMERTGYNFGISMLLAGIHQFIGYLVSSLFLYKFHRKKGLLLTTILSSLVGLSFLLPFIKDNQILQSIMISIARLCSVFAYSFFVLLQLESFSVEIVGTGVAVTDSLGQILKIIVPYLINKMNDIGIHPIILCSILFLIFGIIPLFFLKQTLVNKATEPLEHDNNKNKQVKNNSLEQNLMIDS